MRTPPRNGASDPLPRNLDAEKALLGTMIFNGYFDTSILLRTVDFSSQAHKIFYRTLD